MQKIIGIRFRKAGKIYYFDPGDDVIEKGQFVVVDTSRGLECGKVVLEIREVPEAELPALCNSVTIPVLRKIHRKATKADLARLRENRESEKEAYQICLEKIVENNLPMKLINVNYTFDMAKIIFYFTADGRVDFRDLVRDLASIFHTRIELRQVGVRDEAKALGGTGCCGRPLCCANFLGDFAPVSIKMAKEQGLSLNPTKISGICGRLLCCLKYESEFYHEKYMENFQHFIPERGDRVILDEGEGRIVASNPVTKTATVYLDTRRTVMAKWEDILPVEKNAANKPEETIPEGTAEEISELAETAKETEKIVATEQPQQPQKNFSKQNNYRKSAKNFKQKTNKQKNFDNVERPRKNFSKSNKFSHTQPRRFGDYKK